MKRFLLPLAVALLAPLSAPLSAQAADYVIDTKGAHASIQFRIQHLGYSWLSGRFNDFEGTFSYDADAPEATKVAVSIDTASIDTNHAERDKHLKSGDFFDVAEHPEAKFVASGLETTGEGRAKLSGDLTLRGVTKPVVLDVQKVGEGQDPWGGYRAGFTGTTTITLADYGMTFNLGPASTQAEVILNVEGVRQ